MLTGGQQQTHRHIKALMRARETHQRVSVLERKATEETPCVIIYRKNPQKLATARNRSQKSDLILE